MKYYPQAIDSYEICNQIINVLEESQYGNNILSSKVREDREGVYVAFEIDEEITSYELGCILAICRDIDGVLV